MQCEGEWEEEARSGNKQTLRGCGGNRRAPRLKSRHDEAHTGHLDKRCRHTGPIKSNAAKRADALPIRRAASR
jgi:hypothetical protein